MLTHYKYIIHLTTLHKLCKLVWPNGKALDCQVLGPWVNCVSALLSHQRLWSMDTVL